MCAYKRRSPLVVIEGGTGIATTTAYAPIVGGATATGAFQVPTGGAGTSGQRLVSGGIGALPAWSTVGPADVSFSASLSTSVTNVTGDNTNYTIIFDNELFDTSGNYNNATGVFTAPTAGYYVLFLTIQVQDLTAAMDGCVGSFVVSGTGPSVGLLQMFKRNPYATRAITNGPFFGGSGSEFVYLAAADTVSVRIQVLGGAGATAGITGTSAYPTRFAGYKVA